MSGQRNQALRSVFPPGGIWGGETSTPSGSQPVTSPGEGTNLPTNAGQANSLAPAVPPQQRLHASSVDPTLPLTNPLMDTSSHPPRNSDNPRATPIPLDIDSLSLEERRQLYHQFSIGAFGPESRLPQFYNREELNQPIPVQSPPQQQGILTGFNPQPQTPRNFPQEYHPPSVPYPQSSLFRQQFTNNGSFQQSPSSFEQLQTTNMGSSQQFPMNLPQNQDMHSFAQAWIPVASRQNMPAGNRRRQTIQNDFPLSLPAETSQFQSVQSNSLGNQSAETGQFQSVLSNSLGNPSAETGQAQPVPYIFQVNRPVNNSQRRPVQNRLQRNRGGSHSQRRPVQSTYQQNQSVNNNQPQLAQNISLLDQTVHSGQLQQVQNNPWRNPTVNIGQFDFDFQPLQNNLQEQIGNHRQRIRNNNSRTTQAVNENRDRQNLGGRQSQAVNTSQFQQPNSQPRPRIINIQGGPPSSSNQLEVQRPLSNIQGGPPSSSNQLQVRRPVSNIQGGRLPGSNQPQPRIINVQGGPTSSSNLLQVQRPLSSVQGGPPSSSNQPHVQRFVCNVQGGPPSSSSQPRVQRPVSSIQGGRLPGSNQPQPRIIDIQGGPPSSTNQSQLGTSSIRGGRPSRSIQTQPREGSTPQDPLLSDRQQDLPQRNDIRQPLSNPRRSSLRNFESQQNLFPHAMASQSTSANSASGPSNPHAPASTDMGAPSAAANASAPASTDMGAPSATSTPAPPAAANASAPALNMPQRQQRDPFDINIIRANMDKLLEEPGFSDERTAGMMLGGEWEHAEWRFLSQHGRALAGMEPPQLTRRQEVEAALEKGRQAYDEAYQRNLHEMEHGPDCACNGGNWPRDPPEPTWTVTPGVNPGEEHFSDAARDIYKR